MTQSPWTQAQKGYIFVGYPTGEIYYANANADVHEAFHKARLQLMYGETTNVFDPASLSSKKKCQYAAPMYANAFILIDVQ